MIALLFITLAAICKAVADTLAHHFYVSAFKGLNQSFWNPEVSWHSAPYLPFTKYKVDAWHLFNSAMIVFMCAAVVFHQHLLKWWIELLIAGGCWNLAFNVFYNKILQSK